ncbi:hypothetical protein FJ970_24850 [Mesorhizobium sp. B2-1-8]|uniref:hypothetical protein n=1 Tax=unclassified Mesorhizobium TaxID=325217 RepID=UPI0015E2FEA0|nr:MULTISPECIES: hypothetical protein [unclassified Mesorhizobium]MBZ9673226.1 hypothetical protein [Mesorhizobium sp. ES1-3]MBZ9706819.1 hypothetical protein [Mesorhizobium sp. ESP7-2]UCI18293.1 hypothetical protein FJ970_24850 [Mesorhizobium sp. B2-1-8]
MEQGSTNDVEPDIHGGSMTKRFAGLKLLAPMAPGSPQLIKYLDAGPVPGRMLVLAKRLQAALDDRKWKAASLHPKLPSKKG